ncbi:hypothetical protein JCGZ_25854 [Jatropha curcas]|uniref:Uncharacterized protein n=1 Tax=Jatropha curcas TaxID=180498 RepID=A0A067JJY3_JATCU|nr:hypothetical protein JCGZ_25854 [Jatropha curcas]
MSWKSKAWAWAVLGSVAAMEELKDNKLCRLKSFQDRSPFPTFTKNSSEILESRRAAIANNEKLNPSAEEETLRIVMFLSCWN